MTIVKPLFAGNSIEDVASFIGEKKRVVGKNTLLFSNEELAKFGIDYDEFISIDKDANDIVTFSEILEFTNAVRGIRIFSDENIWTAARIESLSVDFGDYFGSEDYQYSIPFLKCLIQKEMASEEISQLDFQCEPGWRYLFHKLIEKANEKDSGRYVLESAHKIAGPFWGSGYKNEEIFNFLIETFDILQYPNTDFINTYVSMAQKGYPPHQIISALKGLEQLRQRHSKKERQHESWFYYGTVYKLLQLDWPVGEIEELFKGIVDIQNPIESSLFLFAGEAADAGYKRAEILKMLNEISYYGYDVKSYAVEWIKKGDRYEHLLKLGREAVKTAHHYFNEGDIIKNLERYEESGWGDERILGYLRSIAEFANGEDVKFYNVEYVYDTLAEYAVNHREPKNLFRFIRRYWKAYSDSDFKRSQELFAALDIAGVPFEEAWTFAEELHKEQKLAIPYHIEEVIHALRYCGCRPETIIKHVRGVLSLDSFEIGYLLTSLPEFLGAGFSVEEVLDLVLAANALSSTMSSDWEALTDHISRVRTSLFFDAERHYSFLRRLFTMAGGLKEGVIQIVTRLFDSGYDEDKTLGYFENLNKFTTAYDVINEWFKLGMKPEGVLKILSILKDAAPANFSSPNNYAITPLASSYYSAVLQSGEDALRGFGILTRYGRMAMGELWQVAEMLKIDLSLATDKKALADEITNKANSFFSKARNYSKIDKISKLLASAINHLHDGELEIDNRSDDIREAITKGLSFRAKFYLLSFGGADLYQSTFDKLFNNMKKESFLEEAGQIIYWKVAMPYFVMTLSRFQRFGEAFRWSPELFKKAFTELLMTKVDEETIYNPSLMTEMIKGALTTSNVEGARQVIESVLVEVFEMHSKNDYKIGMLAIGYLIKLTGHSFKFERAKALKIARQMPEFRVSTVPLQWYSDNWLVAQVFFYQRWFYEYFISNYSNEFGFNKKHMNSNLTILFTKMNGMDIEIRASFVPDEKHSTVVADDVDIVFHRGHSYLAEKTYEAVNVNDKKPRLVYDGGCGGFDRAIKNQASHPQNYYMGDINTGEGLVSHKLLYHLLQALSLARIDPAYRSWAIVEKYVKGKIKGLHGIFFPNHEGMLLRSYVERYSKEVR